MTYLCIYVIPFSIITYLLHSLQCFFEIYVILINLISHHRIAKHMINVVESLCLKCCGIHSDTQLL